MKTLLFVLVTVFACVFAKDNTIPFAPPLQSIEPYLYKPVDRIYINQKIPGLMHAMMYGNFIADKSDSTYKIKLDSIVHIDEIKTEYVYNNNGRVTQLISSLSESGQWINEGNYEYFYDKNDNIIKSVVKFWDAGKWVDFLKNENTFDVNNNITLQITCTVESDKWINFAKYEYFYDNNNNITLLTHYARESDQWIVKFKNEYQCDLNGNITLITEYQRVADQWENLSKHEYTYDGGKIILINAYNWNETLWENSGKYEYTYNTSGNTTLFIEYSWESDKWVNSSKCDYIYDSSDNMILSDYRDWESGQWTGYYKCSIAYDLSVDYSDIAFPEETTTPGIWITIPMWNGIINNKPDSGMTYWWDTLTNNWDSGTKIYYHYSPFIVPIITPPPSINKNTTAPLTIQSDLTGSLLFFTNHSGSDIALSIYLLNGKRAKRVAVPETGLTLDISLLASGVHFVKYTDRNSVPVITSFVKW